MAQAKFSGNIPSATSILRTLVELFAEQEGVNIQYEITEDGKVTFEGNTKDSCVFSSAKKGA